MHRFVPYCPQVASIAEDHLVACPIVGRRPPAPTKNSVRLEERFRGAGLVVRSRDMRRIGSPLKRKSVFGQANDTHFDHLYTLRGIVSKSITMARCCVLESRNRPAERRRCLKMA